jgi:hypothetical protein
MAYRMGLYPDDEQDVFHRLTPAGFEKAVKAYREREDRQWELAAWMVAYIINPHLKKPVTPAKLLGRAKPVDMAKNLKEYGIDPELGKLA